VKITIPFKTPSVNHLYFVFRGFRRLTKEARKLQLEIAELCNNLECTELQDCRLRVIIDVYEDWYCKNGSVYKKDLANREKFLLDAVMESLNLKDEFVFSLKMNKIQSTEEKAEISIEVL
jgi:Holliday junction resolvase RusA-like endonuclease